MSQKVYHCPPHLYHCRSVSSGKGKCYVGVSFVHPALALASCNVKSARAALLLAPSLQNAHRVHATSDRP